jgi:hypothetical protein
MNCTHKFEEGQKCPLCNGILIMTNGTGKEIGNFILMCNKCFCYFKNTKV